MDNTITIVSGLPRSGTSMMMKILEAGGMEIVTDNTRKANEDNPLGYYEYEKVKEIKEDNSWLKETRGKAFKMISQLLYDLPSNENYKVIFMQRNMNEILASQEKMLERRGNKKDEISDEKMGEFFNKHLSKIMEWLDERKYMDVLYINYNDILGNPGEQIIILNHFLNDKLDAGKAVNAIDKSLYRNR
ncbi:MAG: sulfotransferase domain-containing protein [Planctomycetota bacterium]